MLPIRSIVEIDRSSEKPIYLQIADSIIREINLGRIHPGEKLPGTRMLAEKLNIHRNTAVSAYDELSAQGWIETIASKGTFVKKDIPDISPRTFSSQDQNLGIPSESGYSIRKLPFNPRGKSGSSGGLIKVDDGSPDTRLTPVNELGKAYRRVMKRGLKLSYGNPIGNKNTREVFSEYLNKSRGLHLKSDNLIITRGSQMALYLSILTVTNGKDQIAIAEKSYPGAEHVFQWAGANINRIPLDSGGLDVAALEHLCQKKDIRAVYVIPHHQYPTTVSLAPERRMKLLDLAAKYDFAIIEDDYDYDFHYKSSPILPLASTDPSGRVIYTGSFSKTIAPGFRIGYLAAPKNIIQKAKNIRRIIDRQGDYILEQALAELITNGIMRRHLRKAQTTYHQRRDYFCSLLKENLGESLQFTVPDGGMAVWAKLTNPLNQEKLFQELKIEGISLDTDTLYKLGNHRHALRLGFASLNKREMETTIDSLSNLLV